MDDDFGLDPYETTGGFVPMISQVEEHPKEKGIYKELIGMSRVWKDGTGSTTDKQIWESYNDRIEAMVQLGHSDYARSKIETRINAGGNPYINMVTLNGLLSAVLEKMAQEFEFSDPSYLIYSNLPKAGSSFTANLANTQTQNQRQEMTTNIDVAINNAIEQVRQTVGEKAAGEAKGHLEALKKNGSWENVQKTLRWVINAGRDAAISVLPVLVEFYLKRGMG